MTTTNDVREAFESVTGAEVHPFNSVNRAVVTVPESSIGHAFGTLRRVGMEYSAKRDGDFLMVAVSVDNQDTLGDLF